MQSREIFSARQACSYDVTAPGWFRGIPEHLVQPVQLPDDAAAAAAAVVAEQPFRVGQKFKNAGK